MSVTNSSANNAETPSSAEISPDSTSTEQDENPNVRLSVNINTETADTIRRLATGQGVTVTEIIRRLVSIGVYFEDAQTNGKRILTEDPISGKLTQLVIQH